MLPSALGAVFWRRFQAGTPVPAATWNALSAVPWGCTSLRLTLLPSPRLPEEARQRRVFEMVEALQEHPRDPNQLLIGYSRGLLVIWDLRGGRVLCHFLSSQVGGAWAGDRCHGAPRPHYHIEPLGQGVRWGVGDGNITLTPACALPLSAPEATGQCLLAAGRPPDCQLPLRWQLLPVARVSRHPATGALAQLHAVWSVLRLPVGAGPGPVTWGCLSLSVPSRSCLRSGSGAGAQLIEVKPGAQRGDGSVQSHPVGFLTPVVAFSGQDPQAQAHRVGVERGVGACRPTCLRGTRSS